LDLGGARIGVAPLVLPDQFCLPLFGNSHWLPRLLHLGRLGGMLLLEARSFHRVYYNYALQ
jgi:hypothetical protein